jgi:hypothetical protein
MVRESGAEKQERRTIYRSVDRMERALAAVWLATAELSPIEKLTVLNAALQEALAADKAQRRPVPR